MTFGVSRFAYAINDHTQKKTETNQKNALVIQEINEQPLIVYFSISPSFNTLMLATVTAIKTSESETQTDRCVLVVRSGIKVRFYNKKTTTTSD